MHDERDSIDGELDELIGAAFSYLEMNRIQIKCAVGNQRSINIPKRLAFRFEGIERAGEWLNDRFVDLEVYSMLRSDWIK
jgi:ribosomal-protein-serine acetyltransferase